MKKILILSALISILLAGCMSDNLITENPVVQGDQKLTWLKISDNPLQVEAQTVLSKVINGNSGGKITINEIIGGIEITGALTVPAGSYPGNQNISITLNDSWLYQVYSPSPYVFRSSLILDLQYKNVNLSNIDPATVGFYFLSENGTYYQAQYDSLIYDPESGTIGIVKAKIPHFSRWGWAKVDDEDPE
jgi:hypothetical protein